MSDLLYHYTDEAGLTGIIGNDNLWATDIEFLNDYSEFKVALVGKYMRILLNSYKENLPLDIDEEALRLLKQVIERRAEDILQMILGSKESSEAFVCSLTRANGQEEDDPGNRLSMWRGYGGSGQGYSLGFDAELLEKRLGQCCVPGKNTLVECLYKEVEKEQAIKDIGRVAACGFVEIRREGNPPRGSFTTKILGATDEYKKDSYYLRKALSTATAEYFRSAARIKHQGFYEESETRIISLPTRDALAGSNLPDDNKKEVVKFRKGAFGSTRYIEIRLGLDDAKTSPLRRIVVGPGPDQDERKKRVEHLLQEKGIEFDAGEEICKEQKAEENSKVRIDVSQIPYRTR